MNKRSFNLKVISLLLLFCSASLVIAIPNRVAYLPGLHYSFKEKEDWTVSFRYNAATRRYVDMAVFPGVKPYYQSESVYSGMSNWHTFTMTPYGFYRDTVVLTERPTEIELTGLSEIIDAIEENVPDFDGIITR